MNLTNPDVIYWFATSYLDGIGPVRLRKWLQYFGAIKNIFSASTHDLQQASMTRQQMDAINNLPWKKIEADIHWCEQNNGHILVASDEAYPKLLHEISSAPLILYVQGDVNLLSQPQLALVGSRNPTAVGIETAEQFGFALSQAGLVVTSGLAMGIDAAGHRGALSAKGKTIAVMGTGLKQIYPRSNLALANKILLDGAVVSEFPIDTMAKAKYFPLRNRLISGLSLGVLIVEAALKSGSLITARYAIDQGREVFAVPGSIHHPLAKGCHYLIRQGAKLVESIEDILVELPSLRNYVLSHLPQQAVLKSGAVEDLEGSQKQFLMQIGYEPTPLDILVLRSGLTTSEVSSMLLVLELKGCVGVVPGGYIRI
jgi:DNA processing protein